MPPAKILDLNQKNVQITQQLATSMRRFLLIDIDSYLFGKQRADKEEKKWRAYKWILVTFNCAYILRTIILLLTDSQHIKDSFGEFFRFFGGVNVKLCLVALLSHVSLPALIAPFNGYFISRNDRYRRGLISSLEILNVISGKVNPKEIGLLDEDLPKLRRHASICAFMSFYGGMIVDLMMLIYAPYLYVTNIDYVSYWWQLIVAKFMLDGIIVMSFSALISSLAYFYLICLVIGIRIQRLRAEIFESKFSLETAMELLKNHNSIATSISKYNSYWKVFIALSYLDYLPLMSIMCYITFVAEMHPYLKFIYVLLFFEYSALISFTCLAAGAVANAMSLIKFKLY